MIARTFLTLGPAGLALEWLNEDTLEPDHLASSPAPALDAALSEASRDVDALVDMANPNADESAGAWIIHHPSRGGPSSGLREVMMASEIYGRRAAPVLGLTWELPAPARRLSREERFASIGLAAPVLYPRRNRPGQWGARARMLRAAPRQGSPAARA